MMNEDDDMLLPPGKTCGDCAKWRHCKAFIGSLKPTNTRCDWAPSAFIERAVSAGLPDPSLKASEVGHTARPDDPKAV